MNTIKSVHFVDIGYEFKIMAEMSSGESVKVMSFYPDEIEFSGKELIGLTLDQRVTLSEKKTQRIFKVRQSQ